MALYEIARVRADGPSQPKVSRSDAGAVRAELERILAHPLFTRSKRCTGLLTYIVERTLDGAKDIKERTIGVEVFGRAQVYDTSLDPAVRVAAAEVRTRLVLYYNETGHQQGIRIDLPLHSYVAEFGLPQEKPVLPDVLSGDERSDRKHRGNRYWYLVALLAVAVIALAVWGTFRLLSPVSALDKFWMPILDTPNEVLLCVSSPPPINLVAGESSNLPGSPALGMSFGAFTRQGSTNVSMSDINAANDLASYLRAKKKDSNVRPANRLSMWELRSNPVVIFGTFNNYWATKLSANLRFRFNKESDIAKRWIEDANNPQDRTWMVDMSSPVDQVDSNYAVVSRVFDQSTGRWWIGVAGLTGVGTTAAQQLLIDPKAMAEATSGFPKGWESKNLQIVLGIKLVRGSAGVAHVIATNFW